MENEGRCTNCGAEIPSGELVEFDGELLCPDCLRENTTTCDRCGERIWLDNAECDGHSTYCEACYDQYYTRCTECERIIHTDEAHYPHDDDEPYCYNCYSCQTHTIHDYGYKPDPIFYGDGDRYLGVELEVDGAGECSSKAEQVLDIANAAEEYLYCKHDGSLDDGFEMVTHPMTIAFHERCMPWSAILEKARSMGYYSHQAKTCGLHIHVNRTAFGDTEATQDAAIARVLYFFEKHWEELLKFSRRTQHQLERWAARYGLKEAPRDILHKAKGDFRHNRYTCINLTNDATIEFRIFRGTLKLNTLIATLQLVDRVCDVAIHLSDQEITNLSWTTFVSGCTKPELVQYLKERRLYVNEPVETEVEV